MGKDGSPKVVYHGTASGGFNEFSPSEFGKRGDPGLHGKGFYFADSKGLAKGYSEHPVFKNALTGEKVPEEDLNRQVYSAYLAANNLYDANKDPLNIEGRLVGEKYQSKVVDAGYDGVKYTNPDGDNTEYIVFNPTQIKSATGNVGTYDSANPDIRFSKAYHGGPNIWQPEPGFPNGRPRLDKIGTGEGAAAYGWGWYAAEAEETAKFYGQTLGTSPELKMNAGDTWRLLRKSVGNNVENLMRYGGYNGDAESFASAIETLGRHGRLDKKLVDQTIVPGQALYQLDIPDATVPKLLDWDKQLSKQPKNVRAAITEDKVSQEIVKNWEATRDNLQKKLPDRKFKTEGGDRSGAAYYSALRAQLGSAKAASEHLQSIGIPGNKYLDGVSRNKGEGTSNYVIWDQDVLDKVALLERNGEKLEAIRYSKAPVGETDPELVKAGQAEIDRIITRLRQYVKKDEMGVSESKTRKLAAQYVGLKQKLADRHLATETKIKEFKSLLMQMPPHVRGKSLAGFNKLATVKNEETKEKHFQRLRIQAEKEVNKYFRRETLKAIHKMRKLKVKKKGHRTTNIGAPAARVLEYINKVMTDSKMRSVAGQEEHIAQMQARLANLEARETTPTVERQIQNTKDKIEVAEIFGAYGEATLGDLEHAHKTLETLIMEGRTAWQLAEADRKEITSEITSKVIKDVTGEENPEPETPAEKRRRESKEDNSAWFKIKRGLSNFDTLHQSWHFLMDKISTRGEGRTLRTQTVELLGGTVHAATNKESELNQTATTMIQEKISELTGLTGRKLEKWIAEKSDIETDYTITSIDRNGNKRQETIPLSEMQAVYWWAINRRGTALAAEGFDSVSERLELMGVTPRFLQQVEKTVDPATLNLAEWLSHTMGDHIWQNANHVHEARYGASIPNSLDYTPIWADYNKGRSEADLLQRQSRGSSMVKGALHDLSSTKMGVKPANLLEVWTNHINDMNHFTAWAIPVQQLEGVFNNQALRNFIEQHYGKNMNGKIADFVEIFKGQSVAQKDHLSKMAEFRGRFSTAVLGLNPAIYIKQLSSIPAMAADIPIMDWNMGVASFMANPKRAMDILSESQFVRTGDMQAIYIGGWPVYKYYNDKYTAQGMSKAEAHKKALSRFEQTALQTQQTGEKYGMGLIQQGSALQQLFTMFMSAPVSYYREVAAAVRNMKKSPQDSLKRLGLFWVVVPAMFSAIANAPLAFDDDDEDQELFWKRVTRDMALGPISGLFLARDIAKYFYNTLFLQEENWSGLGFTAMGQPVETVNSLIRQMADLAEGEDMDWADFNEDIIDVAGYATGLPLPAAQNYAKGVKQIAKGETEHPIAKMMGYTNWSTGDKDEDVALTKFSKKKRRVQKVADGLEEAEDKAAYRRENIGDLRLHARIRNLQPTLNKYRRRINELEKEDSTPERKALIDTLEQRRTETVRRFLKQQDQRTKKGN
ncbi:MAG: hypothetical protein ABR533_02550 [Desulfonatronovibrio sp.]